MILWLMPSLPATVQAADGDSVVINAMDYGADPTGAIDSTEAIWAALEAAKESEAAGKAVTLRFPRGEYHIYKDKAQTREYHTSNTNSIENPFVDVATSAYYYKAVLWAYEMGITNGYTRTIFGHNLICSRAQGITFLYRTFR